MALMTVKYALDIKTTWGNKNHVAITLSNATNMIIRRNNACWGMLYEIYI